MTIQDLLRQLEIPTAPSGHTHSRAGWLQVDCPWCSKDSHHWRLGYNLRFGYMNCWHCGHHDVLNYLQEITGLPFLKCKWLFLQVDKVSKRFEEEIRPAGKLKLPECLNSDLLPAHKRYLRDRGFHWQTIQQVWGIQCLGIAPRLGWRIFLPIYYHGRMVSWTTRAIGDAGEITRYISARPDEEAMPHKHLLYGEDYARHGIIINEGPISAWAIGPGAVATLGTGYTKQQLLRMIKHPIRAVCFDTEKEAQKRAKKLVRELSLYPGETFNVVLDYKDAAEETDKTLKQLRKEILE